MVRIVLFVVLVNILLFRSDAVAADYKFRGEYQEQLNRQQVALSNSGHVWKAGGYFDQNGVNHGNSLRVENFDGEVDAEYFGFDAFVDTPPPPSTAGVPIAENSSGQMLVVSPASELGALRISPGNFLYPISLFSQSPNGDRTLINQTFGMSGEVPIFTSANTFIAEDGFMVVSHNPVDAEDSSQQILENYYPGTVPVPLRANLTNFFAPLFEKYGTTPLENKFAVTTLQAMSGGRALIFFKHVLIDSSVIPDSGFYFVAGTGGFFSLGEGSMEYLGPSRRGGAYLMSWEEGSRDKGKALLCTVGPTTGCTKFPRLTAEVGRVVHANDLGDQIYARAKTEEPILGTQGRKAIDLKCKLEPSKVDARERKLVFSSANTQGDLIVRERGEFGTFDNILVYERLDSSDENYCSKVTVSPNSQTCKHLFSKSSKGITQNKAVRSKTICDLKVHVSTSNSRNISKATVGLLGSRKTVITDRKGEATIRVTLLPKKNKDVTIIVKFPRNSHWTTERIIDLRR